MAEHRVPYHLFGFISMTPALWAFLFAQLTILLFAVVLCFLPAATPRASRGLVLGNTIALIASIAASALTVLAGFLESFAADSPDPSEKAARLASGLLTVMNGFVMAVPFTVLTGALLLLQFARRARVPASSSSP